jgi:hypothetical protein
MEKTMTKKMTTAIATEMVARIRALHEQIHLVYREAGEYDGGAANINVIRDAVKASDELEEAKFSVDALLGSFDYKDEEAA